MLAAVLFALVLFFAEVAGKARGAAAQRLLFGVAVMMLVAAGTWPPTATGTPTAP